MKKIKKGYKEVDGIILKEGIELKDDKESILSEEDLKPENTKVRITAYIDGDILAVIKKEAEKAKKTKKGKYGYQSLINDVLRDVFINDKKTINEKKTSELTVSELTDLIVRSTQLNELLNERDKLKDELKEA